MKRFINISFLSLVFAGMALTGCNDDLTTSSYVKVNDEDPSFRFYRHRLIIR